MVVIQVTALFNIIAYANIAKLVPGSHRPSVRNKTAQTFPPEHHFFRFRSVKISNKKYQKELVKAEES